MDISEFKRRRQYLMDNMGKDSIAIIPTATEKVRNHDMHYPFRPDSNFYYLTGFPEPQAIAVLVPEREQGQYILFCREKDIEQEIWHGRRAGLEGACELYGADDAFPITDIDDIIPGLIESCRRLYYPVNVFPEFDAKVAEWMIVLRNRIRSGIVPPHEVIALDHVLSEMRVYKSPLEIETIRKAIAITVDAHLKAMRCCQAKMYEYEIEAELIHEFMKQGSRAPAYPSIVAGGKNACILHYTENNTLLNSGELLLIDAGAEFDYYASDLTRTFPINGQFSEPQKALYELVLTAQLTAIAQIKPGNHWNDPQQAAVEVIIHGLKDLGLLLGKFETIFEEESYKRFYKHRIGHWMGMDVHDVGSYKINNAWRVFEPGMVMTIEPGLYIPASDDVESQWWDIGIRIEDNVVVTETGNEVLSADLPKKIKDIETVMTK